MGDVKVQTGEAFEHFKNRVSNVKNKTVEAGAEALSNKVRNFNDAMETGRQNVLVYKLKKEENMLENFVKVADMPQEVIEKYKDQVPAELVQIWQEGGLGTFLDGYLKVINPDDYLELLQDSYFRGDIAFPMFVTAFGDIITWEKNTYVGIVQYNIQDLDIMIKRMDRFIEYVDDEDFKDDYFDIPLYKKAVAKHGQLAYDECFGFVPLLALGGFKDMDHMDKVKVLEHIYLMYQLTGGVFDD